MHISFANFETEVDPTVLARGRAYFEAGRVTALDKNEDGWTATVLGSVPYQVVVIDKREDNLSLSCTCPYDRGPVCKHMVAVLLTISGPDGGEPENGVEEGGKTLQATTIFGELRAALQDLPGEVVEMYPRRQALREELERLAL